MRLEAFLPYASLAVLKRGGKREKEEERDREEEREREEKSKKKNLVHHYRHASRSAHCAWHARHPTGLRMLGGVYACERETERVCVRQCMRREHVSAREYAHAGTHATCSLRPHTQ